MEHKLHQEEVYLASNLKLMQHQQVQVACSDNQLEIQVYLVQHKQLQMDHLTKLRVTLNQPIHLIITHQFSLKVVFLVKPNLKIKLMLLDSNKLSLKLVFLVHNQHSRQLVFLVSNQHSHQLVFSASKQPSLQLVFLDSNQPKHKMLKGDFLVNSQLNRINLVNSN